MWKLTYEAPVGSRIDHSWMWVQVEELIEDQKPLWWVYSLRRWSEVNESVSHLGYSNSHCKPQSVKAFKRYLEKHPELKGYRVVLCNRRHRAGQSLDVTAVWEEMSNES